MLTRALVTLLSFCLAATVARAEPDFGELAQAVTDGVIIPAYRDLMAKEVALADTASAFCAAPDAAGLAKTRAAFHAVMDVWQRLQSFSYGPVTENGRESRFFFWPDKGGVGARQLKRALKKRDPALLAPGGLAGKSVALQSLAAVERILFSSAEAMTEPNASDYHRYACRLAASMARFQEDLAAQVLDDWLRAGGFRDAVLSAADGNELYYDDRDAATDVLKSLSGVFDAAIKLKLDRPLGKSLEDARPRRAESWRSRRSLANIAANLESALAVTTVPGGLADQLRNAGAEALADGFTGAIEQALERARDDAMPLHDAVTEIRPRFRIEVLREKILGLHLLVNEAIAVELGINLGFNARDGD